MNIINIQKAYSVPGQHCAFTDIITFKNCYYLGFMQGPRHVVDPENHGVILKSEDGITWDLSTRIHLGKDTREPKFMVLNGKLMAYFFSIEPSPDKSRMMTDSWCIETSDGEIWSEPVLFAEEVKYWRPVSHKGVAYCVTHPKDPAPDHPCRLMRSSDCLNWEHLADIPISHSQKPNEAALVFDDEDRLYVLIRTDRGAREAYLLESDAPYREFTKYNLGMRMGGPLIWFQDSILYLGARFYSTPQYQHTGIFQVINHQPKLLAVLPSMGDASYMGITEKLDGSGHLISYYSSHENLRGDLFENNQASIYLVETKD